MDSFDGYCAVFCPREPRRPWGRADRGAGSAEADDLVGPVRGLERRDLLRGEPDVQGCERVVDVLVWLVGVALGTIWVDGATPSYLCMRGNVGV